MAKSTVTFQFDYRDRVRIKGQQENKSMGIGIVTARMLDGMGDEHYHVRFAGAVTPFDSKVEVPKIWFIADEIELIDPAE